MNPEKNPFKSLVELFTKKPPPPKELAFHAPKPDTRTAKPAESQKNMVQAKGAEAKHKVDESVLRNATVEASVELGRPLTAHEKLSAILSGEFKDITGIDSHVIGGASRLTREVDWNKPTKEGWEQARLILDQMPKTGLSDGDKLVLREVRQAVYEWYWRNEDVLTANGVNADQALRGLVDVQVARDRYVVDEDRVHARIRDEKTAVHSDYPENSAEWAQDVARQILEDNTEDRHAPALRLSVSEEQAARDLQAMKQDKQNAWLVEGIDKIHDVSVAQVIHDIVANPDASKLQEFRLVKGNQLKIADSGSAPLDEGFRQRNLVRNRLNEQVYGLYEDGNVLPQDKLYKIDLLTREAGSPTASRPVERAKSKKSKHSQAYVNEIADQMLHGRRKRSAPELKVSVSAADANSHIEAARKKGDHAWIFEKKGEKFEVFHEKVGQILDEVVTGKPDVVESKEALLIRASQLAEAVESMPEGTDARDQAEALLARLRWHTFETFEAEGLAKDTPEYRRIVKLLGDEEPTPPSTGSPSEFHTDESLINALPTATYEDREKKRFLIRVNQLLGDKSQIIRNAKNNQDERKVRHYYDKIVDLSSQLISDFIDSDLARPDSPFYPTMMRLLSEGSMAIEDANTRGWTDMYLSMRSMNRVHAFPEVFLEQQVDQNLSIPGLFDSKVNQAFERYTQQIIGYIANKEDFTVNRMAWMMNNEDVVSELSGKPFNKMAPHEHPWFQEMTDDLKRKDFIMRIKNITQDAESLKYTYSNLMSGGDIERGKAPAGNLNDDGILRLLNGRGGVDGYVYDTLTRHGWNIKWEDVNGHRRVAAGAAMEDMINQAANEIWAHKDLITNSAGEHLFTKWAKREMKFQDVEYSVRKMILLKTAAGERAEQILNCLLPTEVRGDKANLINPEAFAGQLPDYKLMAALNSLRAVDQRWEMVEPTLAINYRELAFNEAFRDGIHEDVKREMDKVQEGTPEFRRMAKRWLNIVDDDPESERAGLSDLIVLRRGLLHPKPLPESLDKLTKQDLTAWIIFQKGMQIAAPRLPGAYTLNSVGWNNDTILGISRAPEFARLFGGNSLEGAFAHEKVRANAGALIGALKHKDQHKAAHDAISRGKHGHPEGGLVTLGKVDPLERAQALYDAENVEFIRYFEKQADAHAYDIFHDVISVAVANKGHEVRESATAITRDRFDLFKKRAGMRRQLIDTKFAQAKLGPQDYSKSLAAAKADAAKWGIINEVCQKTHVNPERYYNLMHNLSNVMNSDLMLNESATASVMQHFLTVHYRDPRYRYMNAESLGNKRVHILLGSGDPNTSGGFGRMYGDMNTAEKAYPLWHEAMNSGDIKTFLDVSGRWANSAKWAGGKTFKLQAVEMMYYAWALPKLRLYRYDFLGMGGETSLMKTSPEQFEGGIGQPTFTLNEFDHIIEAGERLTHSDWHKETPAIAHAVAARVKLEIHMSSVLEGVKKQVAKMAESIPDVVVVRWPGFIRNTAHKVSDKLHVPGFAAFFDKHKDIGMTKIKEKIMELPENPWTVKILWLYRYAAFGAIVAAIAAQQALEDLKKGAASASGGAAQPSHG